MWAYADNTVVVELDGTKYTLLTKDNTYESDKARYWCLKYWNWHRKKTGGETTEKIVRDLFVFRCFQCQKPVVTAIIPKSDRDESGTPIEFKRTPHFKCPENNCYGGGKAAPATEEFNVITNKAEIPVTVLVMPPNDENEITQRVHQSPKTSTKNIKGLKKNRSENRTSTSIAPICEQFYGYAIDKQLTGKFVSVPYISDEAALSYSYLFVEFQNPVKNKGQTKGIYYGVPDYWIECADSYVIIYKSANNGQVVFIKLEKSQSALKTIRGIEKTGVLFVLGQLSKQQGHYIISSDSEFWCYALRLPAGDTIFAHKEFVEKSQLFRSQNNSGNKAIELTIDIINTPKSIPKAPVTDLETPTKSKVATIEKTTNIQKPHKQRNETKISVKPKNKWSKMTDRLKNWLGF
ncbi:MAG: hypothetical protein ACJAXJ_004358 [Colwellia sp.]|jgi:hypothetical protein